MFCRWCGSEIPNDAKSCPHCGEALSKEEEVSIKALNGESSLDSDFKLSLEADTETILLYQNTLKMFHLNVKKLISSPIYGSKVQLSGPPHVKILNKAEKIHATERNTRIDFLIRAKKLGIFTLTATLISKIGHRIEFPIKIKVEPAEVIYSEKTSI